MLYLIGVGLQPQHLTLETKKAIGDCTNVFLESYTSRFARGSKKELEELLGKEIVKLNRRQVEEGLEGILKHCKRENTALLVFGNPLFATTHIQLLLEAKKQGIETRVIPGLSIQDFLGKTGLDCYRFGRITTIVFAEPYYKPESFFDFIEKNNQNGLHSLCLLDIQKEKERLMSVQQAIGILQKIAKKRNSCLLKESVLIGLYGLGASTEKILVGSAIKLANSGFDVWPQSLIVCGKLNEKEKEALKALHGAKIE